MPGPISGRFEISGTSSREVNITMDGDRGYITVGGDGRDIITMDGDSGTFTVGGDGKDGEIRVNSKDGNARVHIEGGEGRITVGSKEHDGEIILKNDKGEVVVRLEAGVGRFRAYSAAGHEIFCILDNGDLHLGGNNTDGDIILKGRDGSRRIRLDSDQANLWLGGNDRDGDIVMFSRDGDNRTLDQATIHMNGDAGEISVTGDIRLRGADCAERFPVQGSEDIEPGTVLCIGKGVNLVQSDQAYDPKVAGVVSGAGNLHPGIILNAGSESANYLPVALTGKVNCKVDTRGGPIDVGDLLTSSHTPGFAMKAADPARISGAVIGKALQSFSGVQGIIPILVTLQ